MSVVKEIALFILKNLLEKMGFKSCLKDVGIRA